jgi:hypothetical protein
VCANRRCSSAEQTTELPLRKVFTGRRKVLVIVRKGGGDCPIRGQHSSHRRADAGRRVGAPTCLAWPILATARRRFLTARNASPSSMMMMIVAIARPHAEIVISRPPPIIRAQIR